MIAGPPIRKHPGRPGPRRPENRSDALKSIPSPQIGPGNQALQRFFQGRAIQAKLSVNQPGDQFELEADRVADQLMRMPEPASADRAVADATPQIQRACPECEDEMQRQPLEEEEEELQRQPAEEEDEEMLQAKESPGATPVCSESTQQRIRGLQGSGRALPASTRAFFEPRFGRSFDQVRVHTDATAAEAARAVKARAFTRGADIVFGENQYAPELSTGRRLLAHELTHVVQQSQGRQTAPLQRAETDEEVGCKTLNDSDGKFNIKINSVLKGAVAAAGKPVNAEKVIDKVGSDLGGWLPVTPIETFAEQKLPSNMIKQPKKAATKYKGASAAYWPNVSRILGPHVKINKICIGTDKLGHFFQQGYQYYQIAHRRSLGVPATEKAGRAWEIKMSGLQATGVFSNADLEANRDGLKFYEKLKSNPALTFDVKSWVTSKWNEQVNPSYYSPALATTVWNNLLVNHSWSGSFGSPTRGTSVGVEVSFTMSTGTLSGAYRYTDSSGSFVWGKIANGTITQSTKTVTGTGASATAVTGISIRFDWSEPGSSGKGIWVSKDEKTLTGTWGSGSSRNNGAHWNLSR